MSDPDPEQLVEHAEEVREKYEIERQKRLRPEGNAQYIALKEVKDFDADPFTPLTEREPLTVTTDALVVGAGWSECRRPAHPERSGRLPDHRQGRGLWRHLVLEPLPGVHV
jgi:hypothetical protein